MGWTPDRWKGVYPAAAGQEAGFNHDLLQITASCEEFPTPSQILDALLISQRHD